MTYRYPDMAEIGGTEADLDKRWRRQKQTGEDGVKQMARFFNRSTSRVELSVKSISLAARGG